MPISITSNTSSAIARSNMLDTTSRINSSMSKISSGTRVFDASEDAGSLSIGTGLKIDNSSLRAARINAQQGVSLLQIADGAVSKLSDILNRMDALTMQTMSEQISNAERAIIDTEYQVLLQEFDRIVGDTEFNGQILLGGANTTQLNTLGANIDADDGFVGLSFGPKVAAGDQFNVDYIAATQVMTITNVTQGAAQTIYVDTPQIGMLNEYTFNDLGVTITLNSDFNSAANIVHAAPTEEFTVIAAAVPAPTVAEFQLGSGTTADDRITVTLPVINTTQLNLAGTSVDLLTNARAAKAAINAAVVTLNTNRSTLGANMNRIEIAAANIEVAIENNEIARSGLLDVDVASEITKLTADQVLMDASVSILAQSNQRPRQLLRLLEG